MILGQKSQKVKNIFLSYYSFDFYGQKKYSAIADTVFYYLVEKPVIRL